MDSKIFLGKYRVAPEEIGAVGELTETPRAYEGEEIDSGKKIVVEVVPAGSLKKVVREQLEAEAISARKLSHINIPILYDFGVEDDHLIYITEDFEGTLAEEWVNTNGPMPVGPVLRIASQVVSALGAAAFHGIVHHAINPSNLVLVPGQTPEGEWPLVKVLHFVGIVPKFSETDVAVAAFDKSLHFASPEQIQGGAVDFCSEIYSLGCTMWFLLTGTPPLTVPKGPMAVQPAKTGLAVDHVNAMPTKLRRLLGQMLSVLPDARPHDPLAFYRELQDCLAQVERRETMPHKLGVPVSSQIPTVRAQGERRIPMKALALAALFLAIATFAALVVPGYIRHRRVVGVRVGVLDAFASATPVTASRPNAMASNATQPTTAVADSNSPQSAPGKRAESNDALTPATDSAESAAPNQSALAHAPPTPLDQKPASVTAKNATALPASTDSPEVAIMREVRRAEPVVPEVRHAEAAPPAEGPADRAPATTASSTQERKSVEKPQPSSDVEAEATETAAPALKRTASKPEVAAKSRAKEAERPAKPKRQTNEKIYLLPGREFEAPGERLPRGSVRGRFMGVTADGKWMFELPSREIVIVPPPTSHP